MKQWLVDALESMKARGHTSLDCMDIKGASCCSSCHEEWEDGYSDPDYRLADDEIPVAHEFCCQVWRWIDKQR